MMASELLQQSLVFMALRLTVPASVSSPNPRPETRPKQLEEWLSSLPLIKLFESARTVCDELARLNRSHLEADERLKLLEIYQPILQQLRGEIAEDYNKAPLPLPGTSRQAVNLARELLIEEAYGYKLALLEKTSKLMLFGARKQLVPLIEQIMRTLSNSLTLSYQSYLPTPAGVWHEMHELYRYASHQKLVGEEEGGKNESLIDSIYKHAVLMALTDPYRLSRAELAEVMHVALQIAPLTELHLNEVPNAQQLFVVLPDSDKPPKRALQYGMDWEPRGGEWAVGTTLVVRRLSEAIGQGDKKPSQQRANDGFHAISPEVLRRLMECWGAPSKRVFRRQAGQVTTVQVCTGISRVCKILDGVDLANVSQISSTPDSLQEWDVINQSAGGLKLRGTPMADTAINVGDVVAVQYRGVPTFSIGVVRWAQTFEDSSVELGVQMLAPRAEAATLAPTIGNHHPKSALLLPEISALQQPAFVIAQPGNYQLHREFALTHGGKTTTIRGSELIEKTVYYELFRFLPA
ncbi:MAG: hypothetical protein V4568_02240 [Pseudomonadota bacterium]